MVFIVRHTVNECRTDYPEGQLRLTPPASALQSPISTIPGGPPCPTIILKRNCATGTVVDAFFCEQEDAHSYFLLIQGLVQHLGVPVALNTDRHAVFRCCFSGTRPAPASRDADPIQPGHGRARDTNDFAPSPQAKEPVSEV